jgi:ankyrin repeat protein
MRIERTKGLRPLSLFVLGWGLATSVGAQVLPPWQFDGLAQRDVDVWQEQAKPALPPSDGRPVDDAAFAAVSRGGPWTASDWQPLNRAQARLFEMARSAQWDALLQTLKDTDAPPDVRDGDGATLLTLAARQGRADIVRELLRRGAEVDRRGVNGHTPLTAAAQGGHDLIVRELLRQGADPERWNAQGQSPLHEAARQGQVRVLRTLLAAGSPISAWNKVGHAPLHAAAHTGHTAAVRALVEAGVPASALDEHGLNAVHAAAVNRHFDTVAWLRERGVPVQGPLTQALLDRPADPLPVVP